jgi:hypothetical protein
VPVPDAGQVLSVVLALQLVGAAAWMLVNRPQRGVLLLAALTPFDGLLLLIPEPGLLAGWKEGLVLAVLLAAFMAPEQARAARPRWPPFGAAVVGLVLLSALSALVVGGTQALIGMKLNAFYVLLLVVLVRCPLSWAERDRLVTVLMSVGAVTASVGLWQQVVGGDVLNALGYEYDETIRTAGGFLRSFSTFNQPFPFGFYLMVVLLVGLPVALADHRRVRNRLFLAFLPVLLAGTLSSIVRAALLGLVMGAVLLWATGYRRLAHFVPPVLAVALFVPLELYGTLLSPSSLAERQASWAAGLGEVLRAPFGNGIGSTGSAAEKTADVTGSSVELYQPDNYWFKTAYELGPLGVWMLALLLLTAFLTARHVAQRLREQAAADGEDDPQAQRRSRQDAALAAGIAGVVAASAVAMLVATYLEIFPIDVHFWLLLGVLSSLSPSPSGLSRCAPAAVGSRPTSASSSLP